MWNRVVLYVTEKSHVGQNSRVWDKTVSSGTEESSLEQSGLVYGTE